MLVPFLRRPGDLRAGRRVHDIVKLGALEADARNRCFLWERACSRPIGVATKVAPTGFVLIALHLHRRRLAERDERGGQGLVDDAVGLRGALVVERMAARQHERVGPVVAVVHDAAAGGPAAEIERFAVRQVRTDKPDLLAVAEGAGRAAPLVVPEARGVCGRVALEEQEILRHVLGGGGGADRQDVQVHRAGLTPPRRPAIGARRAPACSGQRAWAGGSWPSAAPCAGSRAGPGPRCR